MYAKIKEGKVQGRRVKIIRKIVRYKGVVNVTDGRCR
jgi:hypothetical protein